MATTKIWPVKDSLARVVNYAQNPDKTVYSDLQKVLRYAGNEEKTVEGEERAMFVTGVNCNRDTTFQDMQAERFGKTGGNVAYHAYQSFKPDEVTPELCHRLGVELAKRMWGDEYQVLVATHFNTGTYHNHFSLIPWACGTAGNSTAANGPAISFASYRTIYAENTRFPPSKIRKEKRPEAFTLLKRRANPPSTTSCGRPWTLPARSA